MRKEILLEPGWKIFRKGAYIFHRVLPCLICIKVTSYGGVVKFGGARPVNYYLDWLPPKKL